MHNLAIPPRTIPMNIYRSVVTFAALLVCFFHSVMLHASQPRLALVIGNAEYQHATSLVNTLNDAHDIASDLRAIDFQVIEIHNADLNRLIDAVDQFVARLHENGGVGLLYYSGHGIQVDGENYLVPVDAQLQRKSRMKYETYALNDALRRMGGRGGGSVNLVILDACRDNPFATAKSIGGKGLARIDAPESTLILYAAKPGQTASDNPDGRNGLFTKYLRLAIKQQGIDVENAFAGIVKNVYRESGRQQYPWKEGVLLSPFAFVPQVSTMAARPSPRQGGETLIQRGVPYSRSLVREVTASSQLASQRDSKGRRYLYDSSNTIDGDALTAWVEGAKGDGIGEWIKVSFDGLTRIRSIRINGEYKGKKNNRLRRIDIAFSYGDRMEAELTDRSGMQQFRLDPPVDTEWIRFTIRDIYKGTRFSDTPISEISFE